MNASGWQEVALRYLASEWCDGPFGSGLASEHYRDEGARVIRLQNIRANAFDTSDVAYIAVDYFQNELSRHSVIAGDLLMAGLGDDNNLVGRACLAPEDLGQALVKADCFRFRLDKSKVEPRFVMYALSSSAERDGGLLSTGSTRQRVNLGSMVGRKVLLPDRREQQRIANFLDEQTARTDALVAAKEQLLERLAEHWASVVADELGTNGVDGPPAWMRIALKHVTVARCDGPFGSALASAHYVEVGARVIRLQNIRFGEFDPSDAAYIDDNYFLSELAYHSVLEGDVLIAGLGDEKNFVGRACVAPNLGTNALVKADCFRFRLDTKRVLPNVDADRRLTHLER